MTREPLHLRPAEEADIAAIARIYGHHVRTGLASFEEVAPGPEEMARRRAEIVGRGFPYLVATRGDAVLGYTYCSPYRPRSAYRFAVENSIYVDPAHVGGGIGAQLLAALIAAATARGARQMVAVIGDSDNHASIRLHARLGFRHAGTLVAIGFKFGRWVDSVLMQRALGAGDTTLP